MKLRLCDIDIWQLYFTEDILTAMVIQDLYAYFLCGSTQLQQ